MVGICNGFQILCESGLLPGALIRNRSLRFVCRVVRLRVETAQTPITADVEPGEIARHPDQARGGAVRRLRRGPRSAGGGEPCRLPLLRSRRAGLRRAQPERRAPRDRRDPQRGRQRRRADATPGARRRPGRRADRGTGAVRVAAHARDGSGAVSAATTPEPLHRQLGLRDDELEMIRDALGRDPNRTELAMYAAMWSEHCSYKSSRVHLRTLPVEGPAVLVGPGQDAGALDVGDGIAAVFKMESHSHPSAIEPYQGAATGVGGIVQGHRLDGRAAGRPPRPADVRTARRTSGTAGSSRGWWPGSADTGTASASPPSAARSASPTPIPRTRPSTCCASGSPARTV